MDEKLKTQILMLVIGALIASSASLTNSFFLWNSQVTSEKKNVAGGFALEITTIKDDLLLLDQNFASDPTKTDVFIQETPIYPEYGIYFLLQKDIFLLDDASSEDLFYFYTNLLAAEHNRELVYEIQRKSDLRDLTTTEKYRQKILTKNIRQEINNSVTVLPELESDLKKYSR